MRGYSPCPAPIIWKRSPCSVLVGRPVEGPPRCTLQMTTGVSNMPASPMASVMSAKPPPDVAHIPRDTVHGTYNAGSGPLVFLAILSPALFEGPALVDVHTEEPWRSLKAPLVFDE